MAQTKINLKKFKDLCEEARDDYARDLANGISHLTYRDALEEVLTCNSCVDLFWVESKVEKAAAFEEIYNNLRAAADRMQAFGATDGQCRAIAARWASEKATLSSCRMDRLSASQARSILG